MRRLFARAEEAGWPTATTPGTVADLHAADAVWLVSGIRGAATVHTLDGSPRGDAGLTARVRELLA
jgi:4-amino-4-deoxychorismate lyase